MHFKSTESNSQIDTMWFQIVLESPDKFIFLAVGALTGL